MKNNNNQELNNNQGRPRIRLTNPNGDAAIFITYIYPTGKTISVILNENQVLNIYGISFTLENNTITAKNEKAKEIKLFQIPGSYFINLFLDGSWESNKTWTPFEGKHHPNPNFRR